MNQRYLCVTTEGMVNLGAPYLSVLKRHGLFLAFYFYCKIMLYGINYTYYSVKTVNICLGVENRRSKGA